MPRTISLTFAKIQKKFELPKDSTIILC